MALVQIAVLIVALALLVDALRIMIVFVVLRVIRAFSLGIFATPRALAAPAVLHIVILIAVMAPSRGVQHFHPLGVIVVVMFPVPHQHHLPPHLREAQKLKLREP